jgi:DNA-binding MurR/RpiR family transcriptional regulator
MKKNLERTYCEASKIIADSRSTTVIGFWGCAPLAHYLWIKLGYLCDNINLISQGEPEYFSRLFGLGEEDVVVLFTSGRYPKHASVAARLAKRNCCKIVLISDKEMCPLQGYADYLFVAPNVGVSFSNAMAPVLVCEILCNTVTELTWKKRKGFHQYMESLLRDIDYYEDKTFSSREV